MGKAKVIVSGVTWTIINNVVSILYGIVSVPFLINYFGKEEYGLIGIALSVNVYIHLLDMGMQNSNVRFFSEYLAKREDEKLKNLFNLMNLFYVIVGIINTLILFGISFFVNDIFKVNPEQAVTLRNLLWVLALNATFSWVSANFDQLLTADELLTWIKRRSTFLKLMQFVILLFTILLKLSIETYFFCYIFVVTLILPLTVVKARRVLPILKFRPKYNKEMFQIIFPYAFSIFSFSIFQFCAFNFRPLFLGSFSGPAAVAEYSVMNTIASVVTVLSGSFMQVLLPIITKMKVNSDDKNINLIITDGTRYVMLLLSIVIFLLMISMPELLSLYVGDEYVRLTPWICIWLYTLLLSHRNVMTSLVFTERKIKSVAYMGAVAMTTAIILYILLIPKFGVGGVVLGFLAHELIHTLFYYIIFLPKHFNINTWRVFTNSVLPTIVISIVVSMIVILIFKNVHVSNFMRIAFKTIAYILLFGFLAYKFIIKQQDISLAKKLIHRS